MGEKIKITYMSLDNIQPYHRNPRKNERAIKAVAMSIEEYGFTSPIIVDGDNTIINGHTRFRAAQRLQLEKVPVVVKTDLTDEQIKAFRIADNKVAEFSDWDKDLLKIELEELEKAGFDMDLTGFRDHEITKLLKETENLLDPETVSLANVDAFVKKGDIWQLGDHKMICGDSTKADTYEKLLQGEQMQLMVTDPPYGVDYQSKNAHLEKHGSKINNDDLGAANLQAFLTKAFKEADKHMKPGASFYIFHASSIASPFRNAVRKVNWKLSQVLIWLKSSAVMSRQDYNWIHEPILFGWKPGAAHYFAEDFSKPTVIGDDKRNTKKMSKRELLAYADELRERLEKGWDVIRADKPGNKSMHPTMKPVPLLGQFIRNSSIPGATVIDPFSGAGSTIMACEQLSRRCFAIEIDPLFASGTILRWQLDTGEKAVLLNPPAKKGTGKKK